MAYTTINKPSLQFNTALYTGNGSTLTVTGVGFQPDFTWLKERSAAGNHKLADVVRGTTKYLSSNLTDAEDTTGSGIQSWNSDGFSLSNATDINDNGITYASWNWKANGAGVTNTDGTITSTVSANTTSGFSIVSYTGNGSGTATIGHGIGTTPACVILRPRSYAGAWWITHKNLSTDNVLEFNTNAQVSYSSFGGGGLRQSQYTSSIITGGNGSSNSNLWNNSGSTYIAYCFAEVKGFSKFGSYTGNGSTDGTFVYTGFKPAFVLTKVINSVEQWYLWDNKRDTFNPEFKYLLANDSAADNTGYTGGIVDFVSNGFKFRNGTGTYWNGSGSNYIYMAFAEQPLVGTNNVPATAR